MLNRPETTIDISMRMHTSLSICTVSIPILVWNETRYGQVRKRVWPSSSIRESGQHPRSARALIQWVLMLVRELISVLDSRFFLRSATHHCLGLSLCFHCPLLVCKVPFFYQRGLGLSELGQFLSLSWSRCFSTLSISSFLRS